MPPKPKITKEDIINAGFEIVRYEGVENLNVRAVATKLGCSTQPIMYHFKTADELKAAVYAVADSFHTEYIMNIGEDPLTDIGMNYIRFGAEESCLFRFLFQSDKFQNKDFTELTSSDELAPIFGIIAQEAEITAEQAKRLFEILFISAHGMASLLANNGMRHDEKHCEKMLTDVFSAAFEAIKKGEM